MEQNLGTPQKNLLCPPPPRIPDLVKEQVRVPMLAIKFMPFDVGEHAMSESDHLVVSSALFFRFEKLAIVGDQPLALLHQPVGLALEALALFRIRDVTGQSSKRHRQIVVPGTMIVIETV